MGDVVNAVGGLVGDITGSNKAGEAALAANQQGMAAQKAMFEQGLAFQKEMYADSKAAMAPWQEAGLAGLGQYKDAIAKGFDFEADPGYQFRLSEGERGIERAAASRGRSISGATLRELGRYNSGLASQEYAAAFGRHQTRLDRLKTLADFGYGASTGLSSISQNLGSNVGGQYVQQGANLAQGYANQGAIQAQQATAPFQNLMTIGNTAASIYGGVGMFNMGNKQ